MNAIPPACDKCGRLAFPCRCYALPAAEPIPVPMLLDRTIWKFTLELARHQTIHVPTGARMLNVAEQSGELFLWCLVERGAPKAPVLVLICDTGHPFPDGNYAYLGTVLAAEDERVWHVFFRWLVPGGAL